VSDSKIDFESLTFLYLILFPYNNHCLFLYKELYPEHIRKVCYYDAVNGNEVEFITNNFEIEALQIANLYRHRWDIDVFFKWIKHNIVV